MPSNVTLLTEIFDFYFCCSSLEDYLAQVCVNNSLTY